MTPAFAQARCRCGRVVVTLEGPPLVHLSCYCRDCQAAAAEIDALPDGHSGADADGGTPNVLFRKDHVRCVEGEAHLRALHVKPGSGTHRWVATCCNTALYQTHDGLFPARGVKSGRIEASPPGASPPGASRPEAASPATSPPLEMRIFTKHAPDPGAIPHDVPVFRGAPFRLIATIARAAAALTAARVFSHRR